MYVHTHTDLLRCSSKSVPLDLRTCEGCSRVILASRMAAHTLRCVRRPLDPEPPPEPSVGRAASSGMPVICTQLL